MSSDYGLLRALLKRLPLSKVFNGVSLGGLGRHFSKKKSTGPPKSVCVRFESCLPP